MISRARLRLSETNLLVLLALAIGLVGGLSAVALEHLIQLIEDVAFDVADAASHVIGRFGIVVAPVLGALIAGPIVFRLALEAKGHGVPEVIEAVALRGGRIRTRVAAVKSVASAVTIGSGGSAGREGPIVQIGASLGSLISRACRMSDRRARTLVAAGAAAGIAAAFNAPLAGVFFALEVILQDFSGGGFATIVVSAVTASAVWRTFYGNEAVIAVPPHQTEHAVELAFYALLGLLAALAALLFVKTLYWIEDRFDTLRVLNDIKPAMGAIVVGLVGVGSILVLGSGITGINDALAGNLATSTMLLLLFGKILATSFTLGSGASGGVFSPSLFVGAMLGGVFGDLLQELFPGTVGPATAYTVIGMAAVFAAAAQAPISSIVIVFEITNDYRIIAPLMLTCVVATIVYSRLSRDSVYTTKLRRKGIELEQGRERHLLEAIPIERAFHPMFARLRLPATVDDAARLLEGSRQAAIIVVSDGDQLEGVAFAGAIREALAEGTTELDGIVTRDAPVARPGDSLDAGLHQLALRDLDLLPVVDGAGRVLGVATRAGILRTYVNALAERERGEGPPPG